MMLVEMADREVEIRRSRRRTMSLEVTPDGRVLVRAPYGMPEAEIRRFVAQKADWIQNHVDKAMERNRQLSRLRKLTPDDLQVLADQALEILPKKVAYYARIMGVTYGRITIRNQRSLWGSCSAKGNLNFNCLLMLTPEEVQDYVVVHELSHRREMNHSERFWRQVEAILPDYREARKWLKEQGTLLIRSAHGDDTDGCETD